MEKGQQYLLAKKGFEGKIIIGSMRILDKDAAINKIRKLLSSSGNRLRDPWHMWKVYSSPNQAAKHLTKKDIVGLLNEEFTDKMLRKIWNKQDITIDEHRKIIDLCAIQ